MDIVNQNTRQQKLGQIPEEFKQRVDNMSEAERNQLKIQLQQQLVEQQKSQFKNRLSSGVDTASNLFLQMGGLTPPTKSIPKDDLNSLIMKERVKRLVQSESIPQDEELPAGLFRDRATGKLVKTSAVTPQVMTAEEKQQLQEEKLRVQAELDKEIETHKYNLQANDPVKINIAEAKINELQKKNQLLDEQIKNSQEVKPGFEITGYSKGQPKVEKIKPPKEDKPVTAETAGKLAMVSQAEQDLNEAEGILFPEGTFNPKMAFQTNFPGGGYPGSEGRTVFSKILNAVNAKLRIETGAQANPSEVKNILQRFLPTMRDSDATAKDKYRRLKEFMVNTKVIIDPKGKYQYKTGMTKSGTTKSGVKFNIEE
jgi:hypothetical protein